MMEVKKLLFAALAVFLILTCPLAARASDAGTTGNSEISDSDSGNGFDDSLEEHFDEDLEDPFSDADLILEEEKTAPSPFYIGGYAEIGSDIGFNKSKNKLSSIKPVLSIETEYKAGKNNKLTAGFRAGVETAYAMTDREDPGPQSQDDREWEFLPWNIYLDSRLSDHFSLRAGNQIIAWGESNYARVLDVLNPRDMTRPGLMELEDARMPVPALRLTAQYGSFSAEAVTIHGNPGDKLAGLGSDFDAFAALRQPGVRILNKEEDRFSASPEGAGIKLTRSFNGVDISLAAARTHDGTPVLSYRGIDGGDLTFVPVFEKMTTLGAAVSLVRDAALFKLEGVFRKDRAVLRNDVQSQVMAQLGAGILQPTVRSWEDCDQVEALAGIEYTKIDDLRILAEGTWLRTLGHDNFLAQPRDQYTTYVQATYEMWNDTLSWDLFWVYFNPGDGHILRLTGEYDLTDNLRFKAGIAFYDAGSPETRIYPYRDMDRLFFAITYFF
ncbi:MAG: hypothetical protein HUN04_16830 [Desulfobacter sp.]|nr:MAG: hypothetical protein HUN04_16830 [Desulfobacter sp.]